MDKESRSHMRRMLNRQNLERIAKFARASSNHDWAEIAPSFLTVDVTWNCNYDCQGCIDTTARDASAVVHKKQGKEPVCPDPYACEGPCLDWDVLQSVISFADQFNLNGVQLMGGESLLHPDIDRFLCGITKPFAHYYDSVWDRATKLVDQGRINETNCQMFYERFRANKTQGPHE